MGFGIHVSIGVESVSGLASLLVMVFFIMFWSLESLLKKILFLLGFVVSLSLLIFFLKESVWSTLVLLLALVSGLIVVLMYSIMMFPKSENSKFSFYFESYALFFCLGLIGGGLGLKLHSKGSSGFLLEENESLSAIVWPFSSFFVLVVLVLVILLVLIELIVKSSSFTQK